MFQLVASSKSEKVLILVLCPVGLGVLLKPVCIMKERFKNRDHRILDFCSTKMTLFKGAEIIYIISERSVHCVVYCIVTCGARYCNQSTPNNPTLWQRCSAWRVLQPRKRNKGEEGGEGTYHRHPDQAFTTRINHRNEVAAEIGRERQEKGTARASVRARAGAESECQSRRVASRGPEPE